jgi:hypothetical protein
MPRGPAPAWTACAPHTLEAKPYIEAAARLGYDIELTWSGIPTRERAREMRKGLYNAAKLHRPAVSVASEIEPGSNGTWSIRFKVLDKKAARAYIVATYGPDRTQWPYNARQKGGS